MSRRLITPYDEGPDKAYLEFLASQTSDDSENTVTGAIYEQKKGKSKRKRNRTRSSTEEQEKGPERGQRRVSERLLSISSDVSIKSDNDTADNLELNLDCTHTAQVSPSCCCCCCCFC